MYIYIGHVEVHICVHLSSNSHSGYCSQFMTSLCFYSHGGNLPTNTETHIEFLKIYSVHVITLLCLLPNLPVILRMQSKVLLTYKSNNGLHLLLHTSFSAFLTFALRVPASQSFFCIIGHNNIICFPASLHFIYVL
jgi:hypothetical protein